MPHSHQNPAWPPAYNFQLLPQVSMYKHKRCKIVDNILIHKAIKYCQIIRLISIRLEIMRLLLLGLYLLYGFGILGLGSMTGRKRKGSRERGRGGCGRSICMFSRKMGLKWDWITLYHRSLSHKKYNSTKWAYSRSQHHNNS